MYRRNILFDKKIFFFGKTLNWNMKLVIVELFSYCNCRVSPIIFLPAKQCLIYAHRLFANAPLRNMYVHAFFENSKLILNDHWMQDI